MEIELQCSELRGKQDEAETSVRCLKTPPHPPLHSFYFLLRCTDIEIWNSCKPGATWRSWNCVCVFEEHVTFKKQVKINAQTYSKVINEQKKSRKNTPWPAVWFLGLQLSISKLTVLVCWCFSERFYVYAVIEIYICSSPLSQPGAWVWGPYVVLLCFILGGWTQYIF